MSSRQAMQPKSFFSPIAAWHRLFITGSLSLILLSACQSGSGSATPSAPEGSIPTALQEQLDRTNDNNLTSAQNAISQARFAFGSIDLNLTQVSPINVSAYEQVKTKVQPALLITANSLASQTTPTPDNQTLTTDFKELFSNVLAKMLEGINNNLQIYQGVFEAPQSLNASAPSSSSGVQPQEAMSSLNKIFQATAITERYLAELSQFNTLVPAADSQKFFDGIRNQQSILINGVINFTSQKTNASLVKQAYQTIAQSLTNTNLLSQLTRLAIAVYGNQNVASKTDQLTPAQPNPNQIVLVVREDTTTYRLINLENGKLVNRISNDTRGLSASDILNQTNVVGFTGGSNASNK